jgi:hypothetical protein
VLKPIFRFREPGESLAHALVVWALACAVAVVAVLLSRHATDGGLLYANVLLTSTLITREGLRVLENNLTATRCVNRQFDDKFGVEGAKIGQIVNARKPIRVIGRTGQAAQIEGITETSVPVPLTTQAGVDLEVSQADLLLAIDDFGDRLLKPCIASIANRMDADVCALATQVANMEGLPGTTPNAILTYLLAGVDLDNNATPMDNDRHLILTPLAQAYIIDALKGLFQQADAIAQQYVKGQMGRAVGFNWYMDQNIFTYTVGALGGVPLVNGANQTGTSLITNGWTAAAAPRLLVGDDFTIAGVHSVNPQSRQSTGILQKFTVQLAASSDGSGNLTATIAPPIIPSGQYQTVDASPASGAAITVLGPANTQSPQNLAFHRDAFTLVTADLPEPRGVDMSGRLSDKQLGVSILFVRAYDVFSGQLISRLDILYGTAVLRQELAARIAA